MRFALRYIDNQGRMFKTAWQPTLSVIRDMADFYESMGCEIVTFLFATTI